MKEEQDYIRDIAQIRSMMERSSKFLSISGLAGIIVGLYALAGAYIAHNVLGFNPDAIQYGSEASGSLSPDLVKVIYLAVLILVLAMGTTVFLTYQKTIKRHEALWNPSSRRVLVNMAVPFVAGAVLIMVLISKGLLGLIAPLSLLFYGLALFNTSKFTYDEVRVLGLVEIGLGLISSYFVEFGLICWALGFGVAHVIYGIYMHYRYEK